MLPAPRKAICAPPSASPHLASAPAGPSWPSCWPSDPLLQLLHRTARTLGHSVIGRAIRFTEAATEAKERASPSPRGRLTAASILFHLAPLRPALGSQHASRLHHPIPCMHGRDTPRPGSIGHGSSDPSCSAAAAGPLSQRANRGERCVGCSHGNARGIVFLAAVQDPVDSPDSEYRMHDSVHCTLQRADIDAEVAKTRMQVRCAA